MLFLFLVCGQYIEFTCLLQAVGGYTESMKIKLRMKLQISVHISIYDCKGGSMIIPSSSMEKDHYSPARYVPYHLQNLRFFLRIPVS